MITDGLRVTVADADLVIEGFGRIVPHLLEPVGAKLSFGGEVGVGRA